MIPTTLRTLHCTGAGCATLAAFLAAAAMATLTSNDEEIIRAEADGEGLALQDKDHFREKDACPHFEGLLRIQEANDIMN